METINKTNIYYTLEHKVLENALILLCQNESLVPKNIQWKIPAQYLNIAR